MTQQPNGNDDLSWDEICDVMSFRVTGSKSKKHGDLEKLLRDLESAS